MTIPKSFIRFASVCCFLSVITTLGIHLFFPDPPADFEERVRLHKNSIYMLNRWWVIFHCLLVMVAMWGFALVQFKRSPGFAGLGFFFVAVFAIAEITRQLYVLFYMNELREQYVMATDASVKEAIKTTLSNAGLLAAPLFGLFIFTFGIGNLCFGLSLWGEKGFSQVLSVLLIIWSIGTFMAFGNSFWDNSSISTIIEKYNFSFQPLARLLIATWLWRKAAATGPLAAPL